MMADKYFDAGIFLHFISIFDFRLSMRFSEASSFHFFISLISRSIIFCRTCIDFLLLLCFRLIFIFSGSRLFRFDFQREMIHVDFLHFDFHGGGRVSFDCNDYFGGRFPLDFFDWFPDAGNDFFDWLRRCRFHHFRCRFAVSIDFFRCADFRVQISW